jgi:hypothetical protein
MGSSLRGSNTEVADACLDLDLVVPFWLVNNPEDPFLRRFAAVGADQRGT